MNIGAFKEWLRTEYVQQNGKLLAVGTQVSRIANCRTVEQSEGDLDEHFTRDGMSELLKHLSYSSEDKAAGRAPLHRIPIDGDPVNGSSTYRAAVNLYRKFLVSEQCVIPNREADDSAVTEEIRRVERTAITRTEREALIKSRVGQGIFRYLVLEVWDYKCAVTGAAILLAASHIKPWRVSTNEERLDAFNGLALSPAFDKAFDCGLITFNDAGRVMLSKRMTQSDARLLGLNADSQLRTVTPQHQHFLDYHRTTVWKG